MHLSRPFQKIKNVSLGQIKAKQYTDPLFFRHLRLLLAVITALLMFSSLTLFFFFERLSRFTHRVPRALCTQKDCIRANFAV